MKQLLSKTKLKRGNAYYHLDNLEQRGLVEKQIERGRTRFIAKHPEQLELLLAKQKAAIAAAEEELVRTLPELRNIFQLTMVKPGVKFYEGKEGIIKIYEQLLQQGKNIDSFEDKGEMSAYIPEYSSEYPSRRVKKNIFNRVIAPADNQINQNDPKFMRETRFVPTAQFPFRMDIKISGGLVSLITFQKDDAVGILIENREVSDNFKILFEMVWGFLGSKGKNS
jgi:sugar-specific transcriptional regulator TrmB